MKVDIDLENVGKPFKSCMKSKNYFPSRIKSLSNQNIRIEVRQVNIDTLESGKWRSGNMRDTYLQLHERDLTWTESNVQTEIRDGDFTLIFR